MKLENNMTSEVLKFTNNNMMIIEQQLRDDEKLSSDSREGLHISLYRLAHLFLTFLNFHSSGYNNLQGFCL